jgi:hypothetical protein
MKNNSLVTWTVRPNLYDYLKVLAIFFMVVDHVWFFLFPEFVWLRAIGRWAFPVFLFLVWFNGSYKRRTSLWIAALIVEIPMQILMYQYTGSMGAMNILIGIWLCRLFLSFLSSSYLLVNKRCWPLILLWWWVFFMVFHYWWLQDILDYWGLVFLFGLLGYWYSPKNREKEITSSFSHPLFHLLFLIITGLSVFGLHGRTQFETFGTFFTLQDRFLTMVWWLICFSLFIRLTYHNTVLKTGFPLRDGFVLWFSRYALQLYVVHIILLLWVRFIFL